jgi:TonB family protein
MRLTPPLLCCAGGSQGERLKLRAWFVFVFAVASTQASAQAGLVTGVVVDSAGLPVAGANVAAAPAGANAVTGEGGEFRLSGLPKGRTVLRIRRLGFRPDSATVEVGDKPALVSITLARAAAALTPVVVRTQRVDFTGRLAGYYQRLAKRSNGYFITRAQIDAENPRFLSQLLQHAPGMSSQRIGRSGGQGVRMRGRRCWPLVWLDGTMMPSGDVDLDGIPPNTLHGIELYLGSTTAPSRYVTNRDLASCGTILLWSRGPDTDPIRRRTSKNLDAMLAAVLIYTANQVDTAAALEPGQTVDVAYPTALFAERLSGTTVAEFVVGPDGSMEDDTFGVVSSTHMLFTEAVRQALESARFTPAVKDGRRVRQVVHMPFRFTPPGR